MKLGIFLALAVLLGCTSANLHPKNPKSDKKTALVDRYLEKKAGIENPEDSLKRKDWVRYVEQKVAEHLKADEEKTEKKHENARSNPLLSKLLRPSGSDVTAVKPADLDRVSSQHIRQPEQEVEGYISRYGRRGQEDNVMKMREVMRHVGEISREDGSDAMEMVPSFLLGHNAVQSGSRHDAHEGHAPMVDPEEEKGHEHPDPGVLTGKHSESLHHGLKQSLQGLDHARAEDAGRGSGHQVHPHQKHQESIHAPHPVGEENNPKEQAEESSSADEGDAENADPTLSNKDDGGAAAANSIVEKIKLMQKMAELAKASDSENADPTPKTTQAHEEGTDDAGATAANSIVEKIKLMQKMAALAKAPDSENADPTPSKTAQAHEEGTDDAGAAAANSIVEKIKLMQKMAELAKASNSENADPTPPKTAQAAKEEGTDDAGAATANSIVEKIKLMQKMAELAKASDSENVDPTQTTPQAAQEKGTDDGGADAANSILEKIQLMQKMAALAKASDSENADPTPPKTAQAAEKEGTGDAGADAANSIVEKIQLMQRMAAMAKMMKKMKEGSEEEKEEALEEAKGMLPPEVLSVIKSKLNEAPGDLDKDDLDKDAGTTAERPSPSPLVREKLRQSGRLHPVTKEDKAASNGEMQTEGTEDSEVDAGKTEGTMEESPKIILQSGEKDETTKTKEEAAANSDGPAKALGAIMKAMAIAKAQQDTSASTGVMDHPVSKASEDLKPALTPEYDEKKLQVIEAIRHATEAAKGHKGSSAGIETDDQGASKNKEKENLEIDNSHSDPKAVIQEESTSHDKEEAAIALEEAIKKAVAMAKEGRQETPASAEAKTPEPSESQQQSLTPENKEKELQVMEAIKHAMEFAKRREEKAEDHVAKSLEAAEPTVKSGNKEQEHQETVNNDEAPKTVPSQDDKLDVDRNAFNVLQQVNALRKLKHMASDEESKNDDQDSKKENTIVDDIGSVDRIANNKPQSEASDEPSKDQGKEEKAQRVLDTMAELQAAAATQKDQSKEEKAKMVLATMAGLQAGAADQKQQLRSKDVSEKMQEKSEDNILGGKSQAEQTIMETIGKLRQEAEDRAHVQEKNHHTPETTQAAEGKDTGEAEQEPSIDTEPSSPDAGDAENADPTPETTAQEENKDDTGAAGTKSIVEKIQLMQRMAAMAKMMKKMKEGSEEEKVEALEEAKEMLPPQILSVVQAKIAEESGNQENAKDDLKEETASEASEAKVEDELDENQDTQEAEEDMEEERAGEEAGENIEQGEEKVKFKKAKSVEGLNLAVAEPGDHMDNIENDQQIGKESGDENLSKGVEGALVENKKKELNEENLTEESQVLNDHMGEAQDVMNPQKDQDGQKSEDSLREEDEDDAPLETSQENAQRAEENNKTVQNKEDTNGDQNDQEEDVGGTEEKDTLTRLAKIKATLTHLQEQDEEELDEKPDETGKEEEDDVTPDENQTPDDSYRTTTKNERTEAKMQGLAEKDDEKKTENGEGNEVGPVRVSLSQKAAAAGKAQRKAVIAAAIAQSHLKAHGVTVPKSKEQPDGQKHHKEDATSVKKTTYYLSEGGKLKSSDEVHKEDKNSKIPIIKNNLLTDVKTSQETLEEVNSGGYKIKSPQEQLKEEKETARSVENKGLNPASPFLKGAFMIHNTARQEKLNKGHLQSAEKASKIPPYYLSKEKEMKSSKELLEEVWSVGKEEKTSARPLPKDLAQKNEKFSGKGGAEKSSFLLPKDGKVKISKEVLPENKKGVRSNEKKMTGLLSNAADMKKGKTKLDKPDNQPKTAGKKLSAKPKSLFGKAVKAGKHRNLAKLREMAMAMSKRRLPRGRRTAP